MLRSLLIAFFPTLIASCSNQLPGGNTEITALQENLTYTTYDKSALQKMKWLAGAWKGEESGRSLQQSFLFHTDSMLEIMQMEGNGKKTSQHFIWKDGHYYYGQYRQWRVTWIGENAIRLEPLVTGLKPMTWTRMNDKTWHLIRHADKGDETIVMERTTEINS